MRLAVMGSAEQCHKYGTMLWLTLMWVIIPLMTPGAFTSHSIVDCTSFNDYKTGEIYIPVFSVVDTNIVPSYMTPSEVIEKLSVLSGSPVWSPHMLETMTNSSEQYLFNTNYHVFNYSPLWLACVYQRNPYELIKLILYLSSARSVTDMIM